MAEGTIVALRLPVLSSGWCTSDVVYDSVCVASACRGHVRQQVISIGGLMMVYPHSIPNMFASRW